MNDLTQTPQPGNRKVALTKWALVIYSVITVGRMFLAGTGAEPLTDGFYMNAMMALGFISGSYTAGNVMEHKYRESGNPKQPNK